MFKLLLTFILSVFVGVYSIATETVSTTTTDTIPTILTLPDAQVPGMETPNPSEPTVPTPSATQFLDIFKSKNVSKVFTVQQLLLLLKETLYI